MSDVLDGQDEADVRWFAEYLHTEYEFRADREGWETQEGTSVDFDELPEKNRRTMIGLARSLANNFDMEIQHPQLQKRYDE